MGNTNSPRGSLRGMRSMLRNLVPVRFLGLFLLAFVPTSILINPASGLWSQNLVINGSASVATGSITIIKDAVPNDPQDFAFTDNIPGCTIPSLDDDAD